MNWSGELRTLEERKDYCIFYRTYGNLGIDCKLYFGINMNLYNNKTGIIYIEDVYFDSKTVPTRIKEVEKHLKKMRSKLIKRSRCNQRTRK